MTPEEVKKRFEKAIESMFASASRHSRAHQDSWATSKIRLLVSLTRCILWVRQWKESLSTTALSGPSLNCWKSSKMLKKVALVMVLVMAAPVLISIVVLMASLLRRAPAGHEAFWTAFVRAGFRPRWPRGSGHVLSPCSRGRAVLYDVCFCSSALSSWSLNFSKGRDSGSSSFACFSRFRPFL